MIESPQTKLALEIAKKAHAGQKDKGGHPYIEHPVWVAEHMDDELSTVVALLHDVAWDTDITLNDLAEAGISERAIRAIGTLTRNEEIPYLDYIESIKSDPVAVKVKLADLEHNSDLTRVGDDYPMHLQERYKEAKKILNSD